MTSNIQKKLNKLSDDLLLFKIKVKFLAYNYESDTGDFD